jgi:FMN reductase
MSRRRLAVVAAGLSQPSSTRLLADQLATAVKRSLEASGADLQIDAIELRDHGHDLVNNLLSGFPSPELSAAMDTVRRADGLVVVTPIFNASYSGLLKVFCDVLDADSLEGKPVLLAATGGTARHSLALEHAMRPLFVYLRAIVVPTAVFAASEDWGSGDDSGKSSLAARIDRAGAELAGLIHAGAGAPAPDPYDDPVPFESLLAAQKAQP